MSTKTDREVRRGKELLNDNRNMKYQIEDNFEEIREINRKINKSHRKNKAKKGEDVSYSEMKTIYSDMSSEDLKKAYENQSEKMTKKDKRSYRRLINSKQGKA